MKEKFTPGPLFKVNGFSDWGMPKQLEIWATEKAKTERDCIAILPSITPYCMGAKKEDVEYAQRQTAFFHLFSAAPDLYEALKQFAEMFTDTKKYPDPETITTGLRIFLPKALEALKRARGESMNLKNTTKAILATEVELLEERIKTAHKSFEISHRGFATQLEENRKLMKEIGEFNGRLDALDKAIEQKNETILTLEKRTVHLVNDSFALDSRIAELETNVKAKETTIRELCRIVAEVGK